MIAFNLTYLYLIVSILCAYENISIVYAHYTFYIYYYYLYIYYSPHSSHM